MTRQSIVTIAGGVGAAKFLRGLERARGTAATTDTAVVNVADDFSLHGLRICPDLDTVTYTLGGAVNPETGWGRAGETWRVMEALEQLGGQTWFSLGDSDLAVHLYRTQRTAEGATLDTITAEITSRFDIATSVVPVTNDPIETMVTVDGDGEISFQDYFVGRRHDVAVSAVRFCGANDATPAPGVLDAITNAGLVIIAPSNPVVSIGPVLAVPGVRDSIAARRADTVAISPIIGGRALKGPADRMLRELGHEPTARGVAQMYSTLAATMVIDEIDADAAPDIEAMGMRCIVTDTIMADVDIAAAMADTILEETTR